MNLGKADEVLEKIETMSEKRFLPIVGPIRGQVLLKQIHDIRPKRILEVGTLVGYSTILMAKELDSSAHITTIEIDGEQADIARENIGKAQVHPKVDVIVGDAIKVLPELAGKFDMVFIDAAKDEYLKYLRLIEEKLHKGSVIVADNAFPRGKMKKYLDYVRSSGKYSSEYFSFGEADVEVSVKL
jgi:predicted O-methyltransferase YrrM